MLPGKPGGLGKHISALPNFQAAQGGGRWDISAGYAALNRCILAHGLETAGDFYACDLAGFILNSVEKNAASMISVRLSNQSAVSAAQISL